MQFRPPMLKTQQYCKIMIALSFNIKKHALSLKQELNVVAIKDTAEL